VIAKGTVLRSLLAACALGITLGAQAGDTYKVKEIPYVAPEPPGADETLIYVLREDSGFGGMRKFAIIDNDTVVGVVTPGTFMYFKVPSGQHEIVAYMSPSPIMHYRVTPAPGKTVYLYCKMGYASGLFMTVIDAAEAAGYIAKFKQTDIEIKGQKAKMNYKDYYDKLYQ